MFLRVTTTARGPHLIETRQITHIVEAVDGTVVVCLRNTKDKVEPTETLDQLWAQQNTTGYNLGMLLVTNQNAEQGKPRREIWFTHSLLYITERNNNAAGSKLVQRYRKDFLEVSERIATILAYQGTSRNLGLVSVVSTLGPPGSTQQMLLIDEHIQEIYSSDPTDVNSTAIVHMTYTTVIPVSETVATLQANMPT